MAYPTAPSRGGCDLWAVVSMSRSSKNIGQTHYVAAAAGSAISRHSASEVHAALCTQQSLALTITNTRSKGALWAMGQALGQVPQFPRPPHGAVKGYLAIVSSLTCAALGGRPDISCAVGLRRFNIDPRTKHRTAAK